MFVTIVYTVHNHYSVTTLCSTMHCKAKNETFFIFYMYIYIEREIEGGLK